MSAARLTERQEQIVGVARDLLTREGVEALTLGRVAQALGIKPPSLYKHFPSKRALEAVLIAEGMRMWAEELETAGPTLGDIAVAYRRFARENPQLYRLMTDRPLPRDLLPEGLEARAAAPLMRGRGRPRPRSRRLGVRARDGRARAGRPLPARRRAGARLGPGGGRLQRCSSAVITAAKSSSAWPASAARA